MINPTLTYVTAVTMGNEHAIKHQYAIPLNPTSHGNKKRTATEFTEFPQAEKDENEISSAHADCGNMNSFNTDTVMYLMWLT